MPVRLSPRIPYPILTMRQACLKKITADWSTQRCVKRSMRMVGLSTTVSSLSALHSFAEPGAAALSFDRALAMRQ